MFSYINLCQAEDIATAISNCGKIMLNGQRLKCYDKIRDGMAEKNQPVAEHQQPPTNAARNETQNDAYQRMDFIDLQTDIDNLSGKKIVTSATLLKVSSMDGAYLAANAASSSALVLFGINSLPRETRKLLLQRCSNNCKARVFGKVEWVTSVGRQVVQVEKIDNIR